MKSTTFAILMTLTMILGLLAQPAMAGDLAYATGFDGSALITLDPETGETTVVGGFEIPGTFAAAFTPDGRLWSLADGGQYLVEVDPNTAAFVSVGPTGAFAPVFALESDSSGTLFAIDVAGVLYAKAKKGDKIEAEDADWLIATVEDLIVGIEA